MDMVEKYVDMHIPERDGYEQKHDKKVWPVLVSFVQINVYRNEE